MADEDIEKIWNSIIEDEIRAILDEYPNLYCPIDVVKKQLKEEFDDLLNHVNFKYMHQTSYIADRHKMAAILIVSILKVSPIKMLGQQYYDTTEFFTFNAGLAVTAGCSLLFSYMKKNITSNDRLTEQEKNEELQKLGKKLRFPKTNYEDYISNLKTEFCYTAYESNYNILGLADKLFWIEFYNKNYSNFKE